MSDIAELMQAHTASRDALWASFGVESWPPVHIEDLTNRSWSLQGDDVQVARSGAELASADDLYDQAEYEGEMYGTSKWDAGGFTLFVVFNNGDKEAWLLDSDRRVRDS